MIVSIRVHLLRHNIKLTSTWGPRSEAGFLRFQVAATKAAEALPVEEESIAAAEPELEESEAEPFEFEEETAFLEPAEGIFGVSPLELESVAQPEPETPSHEQVACLHSPIPQSLLLHSSCI